MLRSFDTPCFTLPLLNARRPCFTLHLLTRADSYYWTLRLYRTQVCSPRAFFQPDFPAKLSM
jgi:hypothetical protein